MGKKKVLRRLRAIQKACPFAVDPTFDEYTDLGELIRRLQVAEDNIIHARSHTIYNIIKMTTSHNFRNNESRVHFLVEQTKDDRAIFTLCVALCHVLVRNSNMSADEFYVYLINGMRDHLLADIWWLLPFHI